MLLKLFVLVVSTVAVCLAQNRDKYVAFVVDDTGSMGNEIQAVKLWIETCVNGSTDKYSNSVCRGVNKFVLATYNDPSVGVPVGPAGAQTILDAVKKVGANGGGDCPEKLYSGVTAALSLIPPKPQDPQINDYCKIFIFTDATAKNDSKAAEVFMAAMAKGCQISPFLTGCCGPCPDPCNSVSTEYCRNQGVIKDEKSGGSGRKRRAIDTSLSGSELLFSLAESTGGTIFVMEKPSTPQEMLKFLEENVALGSCASTKIAGPRTRGYLCQSECEQRGMCWDRTKKKCFCQEDKCVNVRPKKMKCPGVIDPKCKKGKTYSTSNDFLGDPYDCEMFYVCLYGRRLGFKCPEGKVYSGRKRMACDYPKNVDGPCGTR